MVPVILTDPGGTAGARDERDFHLPTALELSYELPRPDLVHILTATAPGYHLVLSVFARLVTEDRTALALFGSLFSLAMVLVAYSLLARFADRWLAFALVVPLVLSHYVVQSASWINTDNVAVLFILLTLGAALTIEATARGFGRAAVFLLCAVWARQLALWAAGPLVVAAAIRARIVPGLRGVGPPDVGPPEVRPLLLAGLALVPAVASLAALFAAWDGQLTPPLFDEQSGTSLAALPFTLALIGIFGGFFAACVATRDDFRGRAPLVAAAAGLVLALLPPTSETNELERRTGGGLWRVVEGTPVPGDRSVVIAALAPVGAVMLVALWRAAARAARGPAAVVMTAPFALALAQAGTVRTYQRYFEPMLLMTLALLTALALRGLPPERHARARARTLAVMAALAVLQFVGCVWVVYT